MSAARGPVVGIIGGMGPEATVELQRRIVARTAAADDHEHVHLLIESNPRIPSRIAHLIAKNGPDPTPELVRIARNLESAGATVLAMPCNTAHNYAGAVRAAVGIPLLDMVEMTVTEVFRTAPGARVGLLASTAVLLTGLYERSVTARDGTLVSPSRQDDVMALIRAVKGGDTGPAPRQALDGLVGDLADRVDVVVLACTELSVIASALRSPVPVIDALDVLTQAIVTAGGAVPR